MEGIRRIGVALKALGIFWLIGLLIAAVFNAVGDDVPMTYEQQEAAYQQNTGKDLEVEAERQTSWPQGKPTDVLELIAGATTARGRILSTYFANRSMTYRQRDMTAATVCAVTGVIGFILFASVGWIVSGLAVKRA